MLEEKPADHHKHKYKILHKVQQLLKSFARGRYRCHNQNSIEIIIIVNYFFVGSPSTHVALKRLPKMQIQTYLKGDARYLAWLTEGHNTRPAVEVYVGDNATQAGPAQNDTKSCTCTWF